MIDLVEAVAAPRALRAALGRQGYRAEAARLVEQFRLDTVQQVVAEG